MSDINMRILLSAVGGASVTSQIGQISSSLSGSSGLAGAIAGIGVAAAGLAIGLGVKAVQAAGDFQQQLTSLSTGAGESASNLKMVGDGILNMAVQTGTSTKSLTDGMYMVESAGYHGAAGLSVLKAAAEGAKVGNADLGQVANAVTTILTDYHMSASQASNATSALVTTVADGKTHMSDLSSAMGSVLPLASSLGISFPQVAGGIAVMTNAGMGAQRASQNLANTMRSLAAPNATAQKSMQAVGLSAQQLKDTLSTQGLSGAIKLVEQHVGSTFPAGSVKGVQAFKNIMGGATGYNTALMLGGKNMKAYESNVAGISGALNKGKGDVQGWSQVQQDLNFKASQGKEVLETLSIKIGQQLLPYVTKLLDKVIPMVSKFGDWLTKSGALKNGMDTLAGAVSNAAKFITNMVNFFESHQSAMVGLKIAIIALAGAIGGIMVVSLYSMAVAAWAAITPLLPFIAIGAAVALAIAGIILVIKNWGAIAHWLQGVWAAFVGWLKGVFGPIGAWFSGVFRGAADGVKSAWGGVGAFFSGIWKGVQQAFGNVGGWFTDKFKQAQQGMKSGWDNVTGFIGGVGKNIGNTFQGAADNVVKAHQWMMAHNYYYHDAVTAIQNWTNNAKAFITNIWNNVKDTIANIWNGIKTAFSNAISFIEGIVKAFWNAEVQGWTNIWNGIKSIVSSLWNDVTSAFSTAFNAIGSVASNFWNMEVQGWTNIWNNIVNIVHNLWNSVTSAFNNAWGGISGALSGLWSNISGWFSNLASQAIQWGANIINSLAQGITNAAGAVGQAAAGVAKNIASFLGFHSPAEEGPGADADQWMPNLINMLSQSLMVNASQVGAAAQVVATAIATPLATGFSADPTIRADQLSFTTAPTTIYSGKAKPKETTAAKKEEAEDKKEAKKAAEEKKKEAHKLAEEHKKEAHKAAAAEKKHVHVVIQQLKHEMHIHAPNAHLTKDQIHAMEDRALHEFGKKLADEIRAQFGNV